jgi:hypothetical protein
MTGLGDLRGVQDPPKVVEPGLYIAHDTAALYRSTDGLHWARLPVDVQPR